MKSDSVEYYEPSKERYVFNVLQIHSALTRNAEHIQWEGR
jgi:hypothetical protein